MLERREPAAQGQRGCSDHPQLPHQTMHVRALLLVVAVANPARASLQTTSPPSTPLEALLSPT
jgi:hypothetical protein